MPIRESFLVNTTTADFQRAPAALALPDGRWVVAWRDDGDASVRLRAFAADGRPTGDDMPVSGPADAADRPALAAFADGRFAVVWQSPAPDDEDQGSIWGRVFGVDGVPAGPVRAVNTTAPGNQFHPAAATLTDGSLIACWASTDPGDGSGDCIRGRRIGADGVPEAPDFVVNSVRAGNQVYPAVAGLSGGFAASWVSFDDGLHSKVRARTFAASGLPSSADTLLGSVAGAQEFNPDVAHLGDDRFVVVWSSQAAETGIRGALLAGGDEIAGQGFVVSSGAAPFDGLPKVAPLPDGRFVVAWGARLPDEARGSAIAGRVFTADPLEGGEELVLVGNTGFTQTEPAIAVSSSGQLLVAWTSFEVDDGELSDIRAAIFDARAFAAAGMTA
jgi:hypothetical protein